MPYWRVAVATVVCYILCNTSLLANLFQGVFVFESKNVLNERQQGNKSTLAKLSQRIFKKKNPRELKLQEMFDIWH